MKLVYVIGYLAAFAGVTFGGESSTANSGDTKISISREDEKSIVVRANDREVLEYRSIESPNKPYVRKLFTPGGEQILRDSPDDHKHHHALMFALKADGVDFWGEQPNAGIEKSLAVEGLESNARDGRVQSEFSQKLDWIDPQSNKPILHETRRIGVFSSPELKATLLTWHTMLEPSPGKEAVALGGEHYFGLGMRFVTSMDEAGEFVNSGNKDGETVRGSEQLTPAKWCAYRSKADGKPVTIAIFDSPENPRHPNKFFTMRPFAYLAATLNLWKEPMTLKTGDRLNLTYGVAAWDGHVDAAEIEKMYQEWLKIDKQAKPKACYFGG